MCNNKALYTEHPKTIILSRNFVIKTDFSFNSDLDDKNRGKILDIFYYTSNKPVYIQEHIKEQIDDFYKINIIPNKMKSGIFQNGFPVKP